jgi:ribosomal protein S18 acetylase RimI-like enzyme
MSTKSTSDGIGQPQPRTAAGPDLGTAGADNPAWAALTGPQASLAEARGAAVRYPADMAQFAAVRDWTDAEAWDDLAALARPGEALILAARAIVLPAGRVAAQRATGLQMVAVDVDGAHEAEVLTTEDVPEVLDLVTRTKPGPFLPRTIEFGRYLGIRRNGRLVSMAGERMRGPGWTEISAVCTDDAYRGQGLAARMVRAVAAGIAGRGETALLHVDQKNSSAIRFYENLGFTVRAEMDFVLLEDGGGR